MNLNDLLSIILLLLLVWWSYRIAYTIYMFYSRLLLSSVAKLRQRANKRYTFCASILILLFTLLFYTHTNQLHAQRSSYLSNGKQLRFEPSNMDEISPYLLMFM